MLNKTAIAIFALVGAVVADDILCNGDDQFCKDTVGECSYCNNGYACKECTDGPGPVPLRGSRGRTTRPAPG